MINEQTRLVDEGMLSAALWAIQTGKSTAMEGECSRRQNKRCKECLNCEWVRGDQARLNFLRTQFGVDLVRVDMPGKTFLRHPLSRGVGVISWAPVWEIFALGDRSDNKNSAKIEREMISLLGDETAELLKSIWENDGRVSRQVINDTKGLLKLDVRRKGNK